MGRFLGLLGLSLASLEAPWGALEASWTSLGPVLGHLGALLGPLGALLDPLGALLARSGGLLGRSWGLLEATKIDQKIDPKIESDPFVPKSLRSYACRGFRALEASPQHGKLHPPKVSNGLKT